MSSNKQYNKLINCQKWRKIRDKIIMNNPLCELCNQNLSECVHHIKPIERYVDNPILMEQLAYDVSNLQALCLQCHKAIHIQYKLQRNQKDNIKKNNKHKTDEFMDRYFNS